MIDSAVEQYAIDTNRKTGDPVAVADWTTYIKSGTALYNTGADILGDAYNAQTVESLPAVPVSSFNALSDVAPASFWSPYSTP